MKRGNRPELMWGLGLTEAEKSQIEKATGPGFFLRNFPPEAFPWRVVKGEAETPTAAWIPWRVWTSIPERKRDACRTLDSTQRILIQRDQDEPVEMEEVLGQGFLTVVRTPLTRPKVQDALFRAKEVLSLYSDISRMAREVSLERDILARKTEQLGFLNRVLTRANQTLDPALILASALEDLNLLLPVRMLHAVFWQRSEETRATDVGIFLGAAMEQPLEGEWIERLLTTVVDHGGGPVQGFTITHIDNARRPEDGIAPDSVREFTLPLPAGQEGFGCLVLLCDKKLKLPKDQAETLKSAVCHLALALRNALLFREIKTRADRDGLTRIYNRQTFEERLIYELRRRQRYNHDLSLLMVDLDHFKRVNDAFGHKAGDMVLREMGNIFEETLRNTDFPARYGGEEFVALLPHTSEPQAWILAERIRNRIAEKVFRWQGQEFRITASIGVSSLESGALAKEKDLVLTADQALYMAKGNGRNMVVASGVKRGGKVLARKGSVPAVARPQ